MLRLTTILFSLLLISQCYGRTAVFEDDSTQNAVSRVLEFTFLLKYEAALATIDQLELELPDHPITAVLRAGVLYCRMLDHEDLEDFDEFERQYDLAWDATEKLKKEGEIAEADLYFGTLLGFRALLHQRQGKWWPAVRVGIKAYKYMKSCLREDSTLSDAYLGVGTYKYWRSRATDFINWLPFIPDQKEEGIALIYRAMEEGVLGREIARSTLAWTLIDADQPLEAVQLSIEGLKIYPGSRFYMWTLADGYYKMGHLEYAGQVYKQIWDSIHPLERNNHYNELGICKKMGYIYLGLNNPEEALKWINQGLSFQLDDEVRERRKKTLEILKDLKNSAEERLASAKGTEKD